MSTILAPPVPIRESGLESGHPGAVFVDVATPGVDESLLRRYAEVLGGPRRGARTGFVTFGSTAVFACNSQLDLIP